MMAHAVIPVKARIQAGEKRLRSSPHETPAYAGVTELP
jgi:hypothetical protein